MPEIEIEINEETGEMESRIKGIAGSACEKTAEAIKKVFGKPIRDEKTRDYQFSRKLSGKSKENNFSNRIKILCKLSQSENRFLKAETICPKLLNTIIRQAITRSCCQ